MNLHCSENRLTDYRGRAIYQYRNLDTDCEFVYLFKHSNENTYLIFRTELYGYGVYDVTNKKDFHYIPEAEESFIWTEVFYNPDNNTLIVSGCIWACPYGTLILDFSNPLAETNWVDIQAKIDNGYSRYDDIEFVCWNGDNLVLKAFNTDTENYQEVIITETQYREWLKK